MILPQIYILATLSCIIQCGHIFSGMDDLDQVIVADIIPGGNVGYADSPYICAVFNALLKDQTCTGFIIHRFYVLAAGYCVVKNGQVVDPSYVSILAGVYDFRDRTVDQWRYAVWISKSPVEYEGRSVIAVIKVNGGFFMNLSCGIMKPKRESFTKNSGCIALSWRFHDQLNRLTLKSLVLRKLQGQALNKTNCLTLFKPSPVISAGSDLEFICLNYLREPDDSDSSCMGADGASLICSDGNIAYPAGLAVTYFGSSRCNRFEVPSIFVDVGAYSNWIYEAMS